MVCEWYLSVFAILKRKAPIQKSVKMKHSFLNRAVSFFFFLIWLHQLFVAAHGLL